MNGQEVAQICALIATNWPAAALGRGTLDVYRLELAPLDYAETLATLREDCADDDFPPPPMKLRNLVLRRGQRGMTYQEAMGELLDKIASVGHAAPEPEWSHPAIGEIVKQRGGWLEVCASTPARAAVDSYGQGTFNTWAAQFREHFRVAAGRLEGAEIHAALSGASLGELEHPGSRFDENPRVEVP